MIHILPILSVKSTSKRHPSSNLCRRCERIDFEQYLPRSEAYKSRWLGLSYSQDKSKVSLRRPDGSTARRKLTAGSSCHEVSSQSLEALQDVIDRQGVCSFCTLIVETLHGHLDAECFQSLISRKPFCNLISKSIAYALKRQDGNGSRYLFRFGISLTAEQASSQSPDVIVTLPQVFHIGFGNDSRNQPWENNFSSWIGRLRNPRCNIRLAEKWLKRCEDHHGRECNESTISKVTDDLHIGSIRLVNARLRCLETFGLSQDVPRYLSLSYVWGMPNQKTSLVKANLAELHRPGRLPACSRTIEDALKVVVMMGETYMWVDVLCIVQDDDRDKRANIAAMYYVYARSYLTIVASGKGNVESGLPGISDDRPKQLSARVKDDLLVLSTAAEPVITGRGMESASPWYTRGWTLQEHILSRRCLLFYDDQMFWRCQDENGANWSEDLDLEEDGVSSWWNERVKDGDQDIPYSMYQTRRCNPKQGLSFNKGKPDYQWLMNLIELYMTRKLSYDGDIKNAFEGILKLYGGSFWWGIPHSRFEDYLVWQESYLSAELVEQNDSGRYLPGRIQTQLQRREDIHTPSWSWMGWKGKICYHSLHNSYEFASTKIRCAMLRYQNTATENQQAQGGRLWVNLHAIATEHDHADEPFSEESILKRTADLPTDSEYLLFWADTVQLMITRVVNHYSTPPNCVVYGVFEKQSDRSSDDNYSVQNALAMFVIDTTMTAITFEGQLYTFLEIGSDHVWPDGDFEYVMRISWKNNIAYRECMHAIDRDRWEKLPKTRKLILLG